MEKSKKPAKTTTVRKTKTAPKKVSSTSLSATLYDTKGKSMGSINLPKNFFGQKVNEKLLAQTLRVYNHNLSTKTASTKTRGEVRGGGAKPWRQKGTGRARAGSRRSPIWVGGGITFGPKPKNTKLNLPKKMKQKALTYALSDKAKSKDIKVISNLENIKPKTKVISSLLKKLETEGTIIFVVSSESKVKTENVKMAIRNIQKVKLNYPQNLNAYEIIKAKNIFFSKESLNKFK
jgi:large subunit ribosomal protein L4